MAKAKKKVAPKAEKKSEYHEHMAKWESKAEKKLAEKPCDFSKDLAQHKKFDKFKN